MKQIKGTISLNHKYCKSHEKHIVEYNPKYITYNRILYCIQNTRHFGNDQKLSLLIDMKDFERLNQHFELMVNTPDLMWLGRNTNHFPTHPVVLDAMLKSINDEDFHVYAPPFGLEDLRYLVIENLGLEGMSALITDGAVSGLYHVCHTLCGPGDELVTTDPSWEWTMSFAESVGASVKQISIYGKKYGYRLDPGRLREVVSEKTKIIYLIDPNNPLGTCCTAEEIEEIADIARTVNAYLIQDCTYRDFAYQHYLAAKHYPERTITVWSFSKWLGFAGFRVGSLTANPDLIERLATAPPNILGSNIVAQKGAVAGLKTKSEWFPNVLASIRENQRLIRDAVSDIPGLSLPIYPSNGNFLIVECAAAGIRPEAICELMYQQKIMVRQGAYHTSKFGDQFIKVSVSAPREWVEKFCELLPAVVEEASSLDREIQLF